MSSFPLYRLHIVTATPHMVRLLGILLISTFCGSHSASFLRTISVKSGIEPVLLCQSNYTSTS
jgi:hypothetical protein